MNQKISQLSRLSRRQIIRGVLATTAFGLTAKFGTGCSDQSGTGETASETEAEPIVIGFIYVGPKDDFGYNQSLLVVEYNNFICNKTQWNQTKIQDKDKIEIVTIVGGG